MFAHRDIVWRRGWPIWKRHNFGTTKTCEGELLTVGGDPVVEEGGIYERGVYLSVLYSFVFYKGENGGYVGETVKGREIPWPQGVWVHKYFRWKVEALELYTRV